LLRLWIINVPANFSHGKFTCILKLATMEAKRTLPAMSMEYTVLDITHKYQLLNCTIANLYFQPVTYRLKHTKIILPLLCLAQIF